MPELLDLPNELIERITHLIQGGRNDALALTRCSRSLYAICFHAAYSQVVVDIASENAREDRLPLLLRTLQKKPSIAKSIRDFKASWRAGISQENLTALDQVLSKLEGLLYLSLCERRKWDPPYHRPKLSFTFLQKNQFRHLQSADLDCPDVESHDLMDIMAIPNLRTLSVSDIDDRLWPSDCHARTNPALRTPIKLFLPGSGGVRPWMLRKILASRPNIVQLVCMEYYDSDTISGPLTWPKNQPFYLPSLRETLRDLSIISTGSFGHNNLAPLDFSAFKCLKYLKLPAQSWFVSEYPQIVRRGIWPTLPHTLLDLHIVFDMYFGFLHHVSHDPSERDVAPPDLVADESERYLWLTELLEHKHHQAPFLSRVTIWEVLGHREDDCHVNWELPEQLRSLSAADDVDLKIVLRVSTLN